MEVKLPARAVQAAFTLIELLVVVAIIALLLAATIPAVKSLGTSSGRKGTVSLILGVLEQARAQAIKDGRATYVAFPAQPPGGTTTVTDPRIVDRYFYHAVGIFEDDPADLANKVQVSGWKLFPTGISLRTEISFNSSSNASWTASDFAFTPAGSQAQQFPFIKFDESGALASPGPPQGISNPGPLLLRFFEGIVSGTAEVPTNKANKDEVISIARVTGRATYAP